MRASGGARSSAGARHGQRRAGALLAVVVEYKKRAGARGNVDHVSLVLIVFPSPQAHTLYHKLIPGRSRVILPAGQVYCSPAYPTSTRGGQARDKSPRHAGLNHRTPTSSARTRKSSCTQAHGASTSDKLNSAAHQFDKRAYTVRGDVLSAPSLGSACRRK